MQAGPEQFKPVRKADNRRPRRDAFCLYLHGQPSGRSLTKNNSNRKYKLN